MEVIVRIIKSNPWTGLTKWSKCFDYLSPYYTRTGNYYTGLTPQQAIEFEKKLGYSYGHLSVNSDFLTTFVIKLCKEDIFTEDFKKSPAFNTEKTELEVLGIIVSKYCEWIGENIKDVAMAAFEDSNYHDANIELIGN